MHLLIIDPQNDFCDPKGALSVPGANGDMDRLASFVDANRGAIEGVTLTLDTHQQLDISHPLWFRDATGAHPAPFTTVSPEDLISGRLRTSDPKEEAHTLGYLKALKARGRYPHVIWPNHCLAGTWGHGVWPELGRALRDWEVESLGRVHYVWKGLNPRTEHFSALEAEVPLEEDPGTQANMDLIQGLAGAKGIYVAGEALSHCVANTVRDILNHPKGKALGAEMTLLVDTMSPVPGFEALGEAFLGEMKDLGVSLSRAAG